jgi:hypothetical protein
MSITGVVCLVAATMVLGVGSAQAQTDTGSSPPDPTVPYLPPVAPLICPNGDSACLAGLASNLGARTAALGCDHDAVFSDAYLTITQALQTATGSQGFFARPDRINHEARTYAQEYFDQYDRWHAGQLFAVSPAWQVALWAAQHQTVSAIGDLMLALNAHIRRDNPIRAIEQTDGVLRVAGEMPAASGKPDHERVNTVLSNAMDQMLARLAQRYDPAIDDGAQLFGTVMDRKGLYSIIAAWREEAWRDAEQLRHARAAGAVNGVAYQAKLAQIEAAAKAGADAILAATLTVPASNATRNAYCAAHA